MPQAFAQRLRLHAGNRGKQRLAKLAADGMGIIVISSDLPEVLAVSDRIVVVKNGRLGGELGRAEASKERVMELAAG